MVRANELNFTLNWLHTAFEHNPAGSVVAEFMHCDEFPAPDLFKQQRDNSRRGLGAVPHSPPLFSKAVPDFPDAFFTPNLRSAAGANRFPHSIGYNRPFIEIAAMVL